VDYDLRNLFKTGDKCFPEYAAANGAKMSLGTGWVLYKAFDKSGRHRKTSVIDSCEQLRELYEEGVVESEITKPGGKI
jgi:hypothetical protein